MADLPPGHQAIWAWSGGRSSTLGTGPRRGLMVRDARRCRPPHHEVLDLVLRAARLRGVSKDEARAAGKHRRHPPGTTANSLKIDPPAAVGAEQMQLFAWRDRSDALADGGGDGAGNTHQHLARRQLAGLAATSCASRARVPYTKVSAPTRSIASTVRPSERPPATGSLAITKSSGRIPRMPASPPAARLSPANCALISSAAAASDSSAAHR